MTLKVEAEITPGMSTREVVHLAGIAEDAGFDRLGISDVVFWPDCYVLMALISQQTSRIHLGPMVTNPYSRHPAVLAGILGALQDASDGRMFLGIGVGAGLEQVGMTYDRPVAALREAIVAIKGLLTGEEVTLEGRTITVDHARMVGPVQPVPISIGTRSPQVMALAGELADIALIGGRVFDQRIADQYRGWLADGAARAGRDVGGIEVAPRVTLCISADGDLARRSMRRYAAHYAAIIRPPDLVEREGGAWMTAVQDALGRSTGWYFDNDRQDDPALDELIDDDLVRRFAIVGTPDECAELTREVLSLGFTSISMNLAAPRRSSMFEGLKETLTHSGALLDLLRS
jgi:5,10-methylenetetrahydromethanopterin reductase